MREGVFIEAPQKLVVAEVLCAYRNFRPRVGTSDQFIFQTAERGLSETTQDLREGGSELPTQSKIAGRGPFIGQDLILPMGVGTSDPYWIFLVWCLAVHCAEKWLEGFFSRHYSISRP